MNQLLLAKSPGYEGLGDAWHSSQNPELRETLLGGNEGHAVGLYKVACFDVDAGQERIGIADEESKLNINKAEPAMLHSCTAWTRPSRMTSSTPSWSAGSRGPSSR